MKTAVEWLIEQLENHNGVTRAGFEKCIQQAKAMEKEQLCYFYVKGAEAEINNPYVSNIEFYNQTFKSE
jgi:hypothetical protein